MTELYRERYTAGIDGDFVVLLIGMRLNRPWRVRRWWPVLTAMRAMLAELQRRPENGLLGFQQAFIGGPAVVQYWRSFEDLERFARDGDDLHLPAWKHWNRVIRDTGAVGIWHETYVLRDYEAIYVNMPRFGLAAAARHVPLARRGDSARERIRASGERPRGSTPAHRSRPAERVPRSVPGLPAGHRPGHERAGDEEAGP
jgi:Domain of unknown function (DUF4188)